MANSKELMGSLNSCPSCGVIIPMHFNDSITISCSYCALKNSISHTLIKSKLNLPTSFYKSNHNFNTLNHHLNLIKNYKSDILFKSNTFVKEIKNNTKTALSKLESTSHYIKSLMNFSALSSKSFSETCKNTYDFNSTLGFINIKIIPEYLIEEYDLYVESPTSLSIISLSSNKEFFVTSSYDNLVQVWNIQEKRQIKHLLGHSEKVICICISPMNNIVATGSKDTSIFLWFVDLYFAPAVLYGHEGAVTCLDINSEGCTLVSGSSDCTIRIWSIYERRQIKVVMGHYSSVQSVKICKIGIFLYSVSEDQQILKWYFPSLCDYTVVTNNAKEPDELFLCPNSQFLLLKSIENFIQIWNTQTNEEVTDLEFLTKNRRFVHITSSGHLIVYSKLKKFVETWYLPESRKINKIYTNINFGLYKYVKIGDEFIEAGCFGIKKWKLSDDSAFLGSFSGHLGVVTYAIFMDNYEKIITGSNDKTIRIWDLLNKTEDAVLKGHDSSIISLALIKEKKYLISASEDNTVRMWNLNNMIQLAVLIVVQEYIYRMFLSDDETRIGILTGMGNIRTLGIGKPVDKAFIKCSLKRCTSIAFTKSNKYIVAINQDWIGKSTAFVFMNKRIEYSRRRRY
ncbi:hypothetical protein SteCoe_30629 [Stentor coeruleus]|uniref:Uncharacterized protein n=1 Tax=Stentor coeruleus TaxID=5963 RepID=A0A1R2B398_9CILI|nr:hypothetical protein SteCoe_30629 [Stentor coeruleus]